MIIIIGTGLAGYQLAREFRRIDPAGPLMLLTADDGKFYPKPQLSTAQTSKKTADNLVTGTAESMATQLNAEIKTHHSVTAIDTKNKTVTANNTVFPYEKLVLACGADVLKAPIEGDAASDIFSINHIYHYAEFENLIKNKKQIAILGAGLIGCEFTNDLCNVGYSVDIIAPDKSLLERFLPAEIGAILQKELEKMGARFHLNCTAQKIEKNNQNYTLFLSNGKTITTEFVLSAIGLKPHVALAKTANLQINRGILVNRYLETSEKNIYALGDCAEVEGHVLPFITPILNCAKALAKTLGGEPTAVEYPAMPITVKTPAHPLVICPPPSHIKGEWKISPENNGFRALFQDANQKLYGFVLTNDAVKERFNLAKQIPALF